MPSDRRTASLVRLIASARRLASASDAEHGDVAADGYFDNGLLLSVSPSLSAFLPSRHVSLTAAEVRYDNQSFQLSSLLHFVQVISSCVAGHHSRINYSS